MSNETKVTLMQARKMLLLSRDPVANAKIIRKIDRKIRNLNESN